MELFTAERLAIRLMTEHHLIQIGWTFKFDKATSRLGATRYEKKIISLSMYMTAAGTEDEVTQVLLHEIAHAVLPIWDKNGRKVGHGPMWNRKAAEIGYKGERTSVNPFHEQQRAAGVARPSTRRAYTPRAGVRVPAANLLAKDTMGQIVSSAPQRFRGRQVKIIDRGTKRYKVQFVDTGEKFFAHFNLVQAG